MFEDRPVDGPSVDKDADMTDSGELKDLVEEVKEETPTEQPPPEAQIRPDNEAGPPASLDPRNAPKAEEAESWLHFEEETQDEL